MANQFSHLLKHWYNDRDATDWVLGTVYKTEGSSYRKPGAMMLFNGHGQKLGLLSGGCLEADIQRHARKLMQSSGSLTLRYDGNDEDDLFFQLGIGCGGVVHILLQKISKGNQYLDLEALYHSFKARKSGTYYQRIAQHSDVAEGIFIGSDDNTEFHSPVSVIKEGGDHWLKTAISPEPHLLIAGGGIDAQPLAKIAHTLGWEVSVWDPRPANARREFFLNTEHLLNFSAEHLADYAAQQQVDAVVLMTHSISLDSAALQALHQLPLSYLGLLGPQHRRQQVIASAEISTKNQIPLIAGPAGLDLGGELPESIALSILAECLARLNNTTGRSLSGVLSL